MCAIAILDKEEKKKNRASNTGKKQDNKGNQTKTC